MGIAGPTKRTTRHNVFGSKIPKMLWRQKLCPNPTAEAHSYSAPRSSSWARRPLSARERKGKIRKEREKRKRMINKGQGRLAPKGDWLHPCWNAAVLGIVGCGYVPASNDNFRAKVTTQKSRYFSKNVTSLQVKRCFCHEYFVALKFWKVLRNVLSTVTRYFYLRYLTSIGSSSELSPLRVRVLGISYPYVFVKIQMDCIETFKRNLKAKLFMDAFCESRITNF